MFAFDFNIIVVNYGTNFLELPFVQIKFLSVQFFSVGKQNDRFTNLPSFTSSMPLKFVSAVKSFSISIFIVSTHLQLLDESDRQDFADTS